MNEREWDRLISRSAKELGENYFEEPAVQSEHSFSEEFDRKVLERMHRAQKPRVLPGRYWLRAASAVAAVFVIGVVTILIVTGQNHSSEMSMSQSNMAADSSAAAEKSDGAIHDTPQDRTTANAPSTNDITNPAEEQENKGMDVSPRTNCSVSVWQQGSAAVLNTQQQKAVSQLVQQQLQTQSQELKAASVQQAHQLQDDSMEITIVPVESAYLTLTKDQQPVRQLRMLLTDREGYVWLEFDSGTSVYRMSSTEELFRLLNSLLDFDPTGEDGGSDS